MRPRLLRAGVAASSLRAPTGADQRMRMSFVACALVPSVPRK
jgi:hypothetical protein